MVKVWILTVAYVMNSGTSTERYGPYNDLDLCKKAATEIVALEDVSVDGWGGKNIMPMSCTPEYR
ncbi:hypothetical protein [Rhizobium sp. MHM7A]|uniref:hypothetical protein n=1 Tax=Rhizobium sp. MHM7A TaxID=2583233 RepID=UPI00110678C4|nr:hypothetical protein [Rhizobium sp. MHM7A]TLX17179.1 hypothetical protein FFR93_07670 [Rhizobium sp. MHM7A]